MRLGRQVLDQELDLVVARGVVHEVEVVEQDDDVVRHCRQRAQQARQHARHDLPLPCGHRPRRGHWASDAAGPLERQRRRGSTGDRGRCRRRRGRPRPWPADAAVARQPLGDAGWSCRSRPGPRSGSPAAGWHARDGRSAGHGRPTSRAAADGGASRPRTSRRTSCGLLLPFAGSGLTPLIGRVMVPPHPKG